MIKVLIASENEGLNQLVIGALRGMSKGYDYEIDTFCFNNGRVESDVIFATDENVKRRLIEECEEPSRKINVLGLHNDSSVDKVVNVLRPYIGRLHAYKESYAEKKECEGESIFN